MNIPTAEEFAIETMQGGTDLQEIERALIGFAKLHVEAALEAAMEKAEIHYPLENDFYECVDRKTILNAYPLTNVK